jgi:hypothetical protein
MSCRLKGYAAHAPTDRLRLFQFDRRSPRPATLVHNRSSKIGDQPPHPEAPWTNPASP